ncbi:unnamed protein product [Brassica oleracea]|uniref:F-box domain-containing protein n=1 Tax=Brassica oleracea TaxID=3712 RepID=A0A3P6FG09_BRAOL|nr:unnamed protein product [Brassica oleracea]
MSNSKHNNHPPPPSPPSLFSLPNEIVLSWLARVPKIYHLNLSWVSKNLRALVRSLPEHKGLRSVPHKSSLYLCFREYGNSSFHWLTLTTTTTEDYGLVLNPTPFPSLLILSRDAAVGVIDGKIYVIGGGGFHDEIEVEVFDPKSETWELAGVEYGRKALRCSASVEWKVYMVENNEIDVYNPREGERERMVHMVSKTLAEGGRKDRLKKCYGGLRVCGGGCFLCLL